jgi:hypothetical protein
MIIYRCDKCGAEHQHKGIVSNMHKQFGYEQLSSPINGVTDVCKECFGQVVSAWHKAELNRAEEKKTRFLSFLGWSK